MTTTETKVTYTQDANVPNDMQPTKWKDHKTHITGRGKYGAVTLMGADARRKRKELAELAKTPEEL